MVTHGSTCFWDFPFNPHDDICTHFVDVILSLRETQLFAPGPSVMVSMFSNHDQVFQKLLCSCLGFCLDSLVVSGASRGSAGLVSTEKF